VGCSLNFEILMRIDSLSNNYRYGSEIPSNR